MEKFERVQKQAPVEMLVSAFMNYPYAENEDSQFFLFKSKEQVADYLRLYFEQAAAMGVLYTFKNQGYVIVTNQNDSYPLLLSLKLSWQLIKAMGAWNFLRYIWINTAGGSSLEVRKRSASQPFMHLEMIAVLEPYQHQGVMKQMMHILFEQAQEQNVALILETDCKAKSEMYKHLGMKSAGTRKITDRLVWYDFQWHPKGNKKQGSL